MNPIREFRGHYRFMSNFWIGDVVYEKMIYPSVEHAFQAAKSTDPQQRLLIAQAATPQEAKQMGRAVKLRPGWEEMKVDVMLDCLRSKFRRHEVLRSKLLDTGSRELQEGNTWRDREWGMVNGEGKNLLGKALMKVREELRCDAEPF